MFSDLIGNVIEVLLSVWAVGLVLGLVWIALVLAGPRVRTWLERKVFS